MEIVMNTRVKMRMRLKAVAEDEAKNEFHAIIEFRDIDGNKRRQSVPLSDLEDLKVLRRTLRNAGCYFSKRSDKAKAALTALAESTSKAERWKLAARVGWYNGHRQFVHPRCVFGKGRGNALIKPPAPHAEKHNSCLEMRGSHKKWLETVAVPAAYSSRIVLGICMALAAPLLDFAKLNSFGILVHGPRKAGKSTLLVVAGSVIGFASEHNLLNFRSTDTALGEIPASFNDMLLAINELGLLKGGNIQRSERMRDFSYQIGEGCGTTYSALAPINKRAAESKYHSIVLASGEEAIDEISEAARHTRAKGAAIRWIDLCATRDGAEDIFDLCPEQVTEKNRKAWAQQQCAALRRHCQANPGVAFKHFIGDVIRNRKTIALELSSLMKKVEKKLVREHDEYAIRHLAMCFALIGAAGILGIRFGTLPWSKRLVVKCIKRCYRDARRAFRTENDLLHDGLRTLSNSIESKLLKFSRTKSHSKSKWEATDGYWEKTNFGIKVTIRGGAFKDWFKDQRQPAIVLRWLYSKNALSSKHGPGGTYTPAITWAESQLSWPDGLRHRSIVIELPRGLLSDGKNKEAQ
jgi:hypothetical protein